MLTYFIFFDIMVLCKFLFDFARKLKLMISLGVQFYIWIFLTIVICIFLIFKITKKESILDCILSWIAIVGFFLLSSNILFSFFEEKKLGFVSSLDYKDTMLMIISFIPTIVIAFFQYKIEVNLNAESQKESNLESIRHRKELCSNRIHKIYSLLNLQGYAINLNLSQCFIKYGDLKSEKDKGFIFFLELKPTKDNNDELFPGYYEVKFSNICINEKDIEKNNGINYEITNKHFKFMFKRAFIDENITKFFIHEKCDDTVLKCSFNLELKDLSLESDYLHMILSVNFDLVALSFYDEYGCFETSVKNVNIKLVELEDKNK